MRRDSHHNKCSILQLGLDDEQHKGKKFFLTAQRGGRVLVSLLKNNLYFIEFHILRENFDRTNVVFLLSYGAQLCRCSQTLYLCNDISFPYKSMLLKFHVCLQGVVEQ